MEHEFEKTTHGCAKQLHMSYFRQQMVCAGEVAVRHAVVQECQVWSLAVKTVQEGTPLQSELILVSAVFDGLV